MAMANLQAPPAQQQDCEMQHQQTFNIHSQKTFQITLDQHTKKNICYNL